MRRIAENIIIKTEVHIDDNGNEYREYDVVDSEGYVLETGRYTEDEITVDEIKSRTGIVFGLSTWITE